MVTLRLGTLRAKVTLSLVALRLKVNLRLKVTLRFKVTLRLKVNLRLVTLS